MVMLHHSSWFSWSKARYLNHWKTAIQIVIDIQSSKRMELLNVFGDPLTISLALSSKTIFLLYNMVLAHMKFAEHIQAPRGFTISTLDTWRAFLQHHPHTKLTTAQRYLSLFRQKSLYPYDGEFWVNGNMKNTCICPTCPTPVSPLRICSSAV